MRFKPGQQVVCVASKKGWNDGYKNIPGPLPNEVVTVDHYITDKILAVSEYPIENDDYGFHERWFEPVMDIKELTEILESQPEHA